MMGLLNAVLAFAVALGLLVTVHEFGHYWVARRMGVKVLRFSVGFGRPLWSRHFGADRTELVLAAVPLGGYVKMLDEREGEVASTDRHRAFNRQPVASRIAVVVAGPAANFLFAILVYWAMFVVGVSGVRPIVGEVVPGSIAERAGLAPGQEILAVAGQSTPTWETVIHASLGKVLDAAPVIITVRDARGGEQDLMLDFGAVHVDDITRGNLFQRLGMQPYRPVLPATIGEVLSGGAAERAGLQPGDRMLAADGTAIEDWMQWVEYVQARPGVSIQAEIQRGDARLGIELRPDPVDTEQGVIGRIGAAVAQPAAPDPSLLAVDRYGPLVAVGKALQKTWDISVLTLRILWRMLFGQVSVENLSGPISIAQYAGQSAAVGLPAFLAFLGIVSVSLGILNLLPIPLLDGGHLLYYLIELVTGKPVSEAVQVTGQQIGIVLLLGLMGLAFYNDIMRLLQ